MSLFILLFAQKYSHNLGKDLQEAQLYLGKSLKEGLSLFVESKILNIINYFPNRYFKFYLITSKSNWRQQTISSVPNLLFEVFAISVLSSFVIYVTYLSEMSIINLLPIITLFVLSFVRIIPSISTLSNLFKIFITVNLL